MNCSLLKLSDPRTASQNDTLGAPSAGIASMQKSATDQSTSISVYTQGVFDMICSGAITVGVPVMAALEANYVILAPVTARINLTVRCVVR